MELALLVDFGSTYTKIAVVDLEAEEVVGWAQAASTVATDITIAYEEAFEEIRKQLGGKDINFQYKLCCSSAAGGLRIVCSGLVPSFTSMAAKFASWGAGGKIIGAYSYELSDNECKEIEKLAPDVLLLAGGTDGGDKKTCISNARQLAETSLQCPFIVAVNKSATSQVEAILRAGGKQCFITENVLPELDRLNIAPVQSAIRRLFMEQIITGKGLEKAKYLISPNIIATPLAVFKAAQLLAMGVDKEEGLGELLVIDVGGATTDVDSICEGRSYESNVIEHGIPEPFAKRTVEGDLGIRVNASGTIRIVSEEKLSQIGQRVGLSGIDMTAISRRAEYLSTHTDYVPQDTEESKFDEMLASICVDHAVTRHAGSLKERYSPMGVKFFIKSGKDLRRVKTVIGTGGVFTHSSDCSLILEAVRADFRRCPSCLKPIAPRFYADKDYIMFAMGLLSEIFPVKAIRILKKKIK